MPIPHFVFLIQRSLSSPAADENPEWYWHTGGSCSVSGSLIPVSLRKPFREPRIGWRLLFSFIGQGASRVHRHCGPVRTHSPCERRHSTRGIEAGIRGSSPKTWRSKTSRQYSLLTEGKMMPVNW